MAPESKLFPIHLSYLAGIMRKLLFEMIIGLVDLFHLFLGNFTELLTKMPNFVWMVLHTELAIGLFYFIGAGAGLQAEN